MARDDDTVMTEADEEAMRAKLREAGWDKNKILSKSKAAAAATTPTAKETHGAAAKAVGNGNANGKEADDHAKSDRKKGSSGGSRDKERDRERDWDREGRSGRGSERRRSRSARRRDKDRGDRERRRDRGSRRRRSRSVSKSRSRSRSASARGSSRREKDRGGRGRSRADKRRSRSLSASRSRSRSLSKSRGSSKRSRRSDSKPESSPKKDASKSDKTEDKPAAEDEKANGENGGKKPEVDAPESSAAAEGDSKKVVEAEKDGKKGSEDRKSRKSSRHRSRSASRSPSRSRRRRRRHRSTSRSRSASRGRRGRGSSRSRSRSHSRRHRSSRRRSSRSRSRSRSRSYSRRHRSKSRDRSRRDANSSPQPHQFPPAEVAPPVAANPLNPSITQLMQQYPTMSLQDIIAKMQASNVTMAAAVSMKPARELYVGNLPASVTGPQLQEFLGTIIQQVGLTVQPGNPILSTWISTDGHFAFCEMRSIEECNMALMLNQLPLLGQPLKFGRPKSFMGPPQPMPVLPPRTQTALTNLGCTPNTAWFASPATDVSSVAAMTASLTAAPLPIPIAAPFVAPTPVAPIAAVSAETSSNKLIMSNIPVVLTEDQVKELVEPFGELKSFELLKDPSTHQSTGSALFEYVDEKVTDSAKDGLDGLDLGGIPLAVRRATASEETGPVLRMANMVSLDELKDDEEFADLKEDVEEECKRFGNVVALEIPRPKDGEAVAGLGDIFVQFESANEAAAALKALSGRKFGGNIVKVSYFPLAKLQSKDFA